MTCVQALHCRLAAAAAVQQSGLCPVPPHTVHDLTFDPNSGIESEVRGDAINPCDVPRHDRPKQTAAAVTNAAGFVSKLTTFTGLPSAIICIFMRHK